MDFVLITAPGQKYFGASVAFRNGNPKSARYKKMAQAAQQISGLLATKAEARRSLSATSDVLIDFVSVS